MFSGGWCWSSNGDCVSDSAFVSDGDCVSEGVCVTVWWSDLRFSLEWINTDQLSAVHWSCQEFTTIYIKYTKIPSRLTPQRDTLIQKNIILSVETTDEISSDWKWYFTWYEELDIIITNTDEGFRKWIVRLNLRQELKHYEDEQLHYSESERRDETHTMGELGSNTSAHSLFMKMNVVTTPHSQPCARIKVL